MGPGHLPQELSVWLTCVEFQQVKSCNFRQSLQYSRHSYSISAPLSAFFSKRVKPFITKPRACVRVCVATAQVGPWPPHC